MRCSKKAKQWRRYKRKSLLTCFCDSLIPFTKSPVAKPATHYLAELLAPWASIEIRRMFGGLGAWRDGIFFALIERDIIFFKVDDENRADFETNGSEPFSYTVKNGEETKTINSLWRVPDDILEDPETLSGWAQRAWEAAKRKQGTKAAPSKSHSSLEYKQLGPKSQQWLASIGIHTREDLEAAGAIGAYRQLRTCYPKSITLNMLWGLYAVLNRTSLAEVTPDIKEQLKALLSEV